MFIVSYILTVLIALAVAGAGASYWIGDENFLEGDMARTNNELEKAGVHYRLAVAWWGISKNSVVLAICFIVMYALLGS